MSVITQFASSLWQATTSGVANIEAGAAMAAVSTAMFEFSQRFPTPKTRVQTLFLGSFYALPILAMILAFVPEADKPSSNFVHRGAPTVPTANAQPTARHRHNQYFRVLVYFAAEDTSFSELVPGDFFPDGVVKESIPGMTEENPIVMPSDVTVVDLENMFKVLKVGPLGKRFEGKHSRSTWESILKLSVYPPFDEWKLRELAIAEIEDVFVEDSVPLVDQLVLGQQFGVTQWVTCAAEKLARRAESLTDDERQRLGDKTSVKLMYINLQSRVWEEALPQRDRLLYNFWDAVLEQFDDELSKDKAYNAWSDYPCGPDVVNVN